MDKELEEILDNVIQQGFDRATELLAFCSRAQTIMQLARNYGKLYDWSSSGDGEQWLRDFKAYLKIQTGDNNAS